MFNIFNWDPSIPPADIRRASEAAKVQRERDQAAHHAELQASFEQAARYPPFGRNASRTASSRPQPKPAPAPAAPASSYEQRVTNARIFMLEGAVRGDATDIECLRTSAWFDGSTSRILDRIPSDEEIQSIAAQQLARMTGRQSSSTSARILRPTFDASAIYRARNEGRDGAAREGPAAVSSHPQSFSELASAYYGGASSAGAGADVIATSARGSRR